MAMPTTRIEPRVLKGFRDYLPDQELKRRRFMLSVEETFLSRGFVPIDTPAMEYEEILLGKGGGETEKQVYRFRDHGDRAVALRFDLTVPFARFMAEHYRELYLPFRRYHIGKVWRGENTQKGRFREFYQCDCDIVGSDTAVSDFEILESMSDALRNLGISTFTMRISHRGAFNLLLERIGVRNRSVEILRIADKLRKIGREETKSLLSAELGEEKASIISDFISIQGPFSEALPALEKALGGPSPATERLKEISRLADETGISGKIVLDASITRGLDYYTGVVFETFLDDLPQIGSVCSGGRYDDLASLYTKEGIPGVGASIGMDRLLAALEEMPGGSHEAPSTKALVVCIDDTFAGKAFDLARRLREKGIGAEVYAEKRKLTAAFAYGEKKGIPWAVILGEDELREGYFTLRDLSSRENSRAKDLDEAIALICRP